MAKKQIAVRKSDGYVFNVIDGMDFPEAEFDIKDAEEKAEEKPADKKAEKKD